MSSYHIPIMLDEVMALLKPKRGGLFVDGTLGGGGHSLEIYEAMPIGSHLFCIDRDTEAIEEATEKFNSVLVKGKEFRAIHGNFYNMRELLEEVSVSKVDGILLDLGVSSHQLDETSRGFSYMQDAPLDMRMDTHSKLSAYDVVNGYSEQSLREILFNYGEERHTIRIVKGILSARQDNPIKTTSELVAIIKNAMPYSALRENQHPAKRTFQAIRIEVN
ncbi:MAG: 16S rRNA (cytosine(1402)-N(4))-methyltransferase RsmH, partial [Clostridiales bacterium]|nr:16S rRNA (cytosine(1402)-N(4))-methyltransferase RsmH [Clostridiales bacterium]